MSRVFSYTALAKRFSEPSYRGVLGVPSALQLRRVSEGNEIVISKEGDNFYLHMLARLSTAEPSLQKIEIIGSLLELLQEHDDCFVLAEGKILQHNDLLSFANEFAATNRSAHPGLLRSSISNADYNASIGVKGGKLDGFVSFRSKHPFSTERHPDFAEIIDAEMKVKVHLSIREERIKAGWEVVSDILMRNHVGYFKVVRPGLRLSTFCNPLNNSKPVPDQLGKDITIYLTANPEKSVDDWSTLFSKIINALIQRNIPPGFETARTGDRADSAFLGAVPQYLSYRYEGSVRTLERGNPLDKLILRIESDMSGRHDMQAISQRPWAALQADHAAATVTATAVATTHGRDSQSSDEGSGSNSATKQQIDIASNRPSSVPALSLRGLSGLSILGAGGRDVPQTVREKASTLDADDDAEEVEAGAGLSLPH